MSGSNVSGPVIEGRFPRANRNVPPAVTGRNVAPNSSQPRPVPSIPVVTHPRFPRVTTLNANIPQYVGFRAGQSFALLGFNADPGNSADVYINDETGNVTDGLRLASGDSIPRYMVNVDAGSLRVQSSSTGQIVYFWTAGTYVPP